MYRHDLKQLEFVEFFLPFEGGLSADNKWIKLAKLIPWEQFEENYKKNFSDSDLGSLSWTYSITAFSCNPGRSMVGYETTRHIQSEAASPELPKEDPP
jgi:hypothetical protein